MEEKTKGVIENKEKKAVSNQILDSNKNIKEDIKEDNNKKEEANENKKQENKNVSEIKEIDDTQKKLSIIEQEKNETFKNTEKTKMKKSTFVTIICISILLILILIFSTVFALINVNNTNIIEGISINQEDVSNKSIEEVKEQFNKQFQDLCAQNINIKYQDFEAIFTLEQIGAEIEIDKAVNMAYNQGREGNIFENNYQILSRKINPVDIDLDVKFDEEKYINIVDNISYSLPGTVVQASYSVDGDKLIITNGQKGVIVEKEQFKNILVNIIKKVLSGSELEAIDIPVVEKEPDRIDVQKIHDEIYKEPQNAYIVKEPFQLFLHVNGVDFDVNEVNQMLQEYQDEYEIQLTITRPEITIEDLGEEAFPNVLGGYSTNYGSSSSNRGINIAIAANTINGTVLLPGEVLSYNGVVGDTTPNKGYRLGGAYLNGELVQSYGGGICQVSSTLYNAVVYANLEVVLRYNHSSAVGYVPASRDATVSYGGKDFKFKNSRNYPIRIKASANNGVLKVEICGIEEEEEYEVEIESSVTQYIPSTTKYVETSALPKGQQVVKSSGSRGFKSVAYKVLKLNGVEISRTLLSQDTYNPMQRIVEVGTGN